MNEVKGHDFGNSNSSNGFLEDSNAESVMEIA